MEKYITKITNKTKNINEIIVSADFETTLVENEHYVFAIGYMINNNKNKTNNYNHLYIDENITDNNEFKNKSYELIWKFINNFIIKDKITIYFHNLGRFDGIFIINSIYKYIKKENYKEFNCIIRNNRIYKITYKNITFLDSILILNESLDNLGIKFLNEEKIKINFEIMSSYENCIKNKKLIIEYLYKDVYILNNIILIIYDKFYKLYNINITENFTIPSIAMRIFRKNYLINKNIYIPINNEYNYFKKAYKGGLTNCLKPKITKGYIYDINSLYPYIMKTFPMPLGKPTWIYKNFKDINEYFGFIECIIYIPRTCKIPPLIKKQGGNLIQSYGYIKDIFFIEEIKNSLKYDCKIIEIYNICHFKEKEIIFKEYIEDIYKQRINSKNKIENYIFKLLMNSLYGRFGINNEITKTKIIENKDIWLYEILYEIENTLEDTNIITYKIDNNNINYIKENLDKININEEKKDIIRKEIETLELEQNSLINAIQISASITAYARIKLINEMNEQIENNSEIYYYDTDSIHTNKKLKEEKISNNEIGKFKLEHETIEGYYLSPKIYAIKTINNEEIIKFKGLEEKEKINFKWFQEKYNNIEKYETIIIKPIKTILTKLKIIKGVKKYSTNFETLKYIKIIKDKIWIENEFPWIDDRNNKK